MRLLDFINLFMCGPLPYSMYIRKHSAFYVGVEEGERKIYAAVYNLPTFYESLQSHLAFQ